MSSGPQPTNVLFDWSERYIGERDRQSDVHGAFGLFFGGIALTVFGLVLFVVAAGLFGLRTETSFAVAQSADVFGFLSVPLTVLAIVVLLPTDRRMRLGSALGMASGSSWSGPSSSRPRTDGSNSGPQTRYSWSGRRRPASQL